MHTDFFQPTSKLVARERVGGEARKRYDIAQTPYQRLKKTGVLDEAHQKMMAPLYRSVNPVDLRRQMYDSLEVLWKLAEPAQPDDKHLPKAQDSPTNP